MSPAMSSINAVMDRAGRIVRGRAMRACVACVATFAAAGLVLAWLAGERWGQPSPWPLLLELVVLIAAASLFGWWRMRLRAQLGERSVANAAETRLGLAHGALGGLLELQRELPAGASPALARRAADSIAPQLAASSPGDISGELGARWRRRERTMLLAFATVAASAVLMGFAAPERSRAGWTPLLHPVQHMMPRPLAPLHVHPGDAAVARGAALAVRVQAAGRDVVVLHWQLGGDVGHELVLPVTGDTARGEIPHVDTDGQYWVAAPDGATSARYRLRVIDALLLSELSVDVSYPNYLGMPDEHYAGELPPLELPAGAVLHVRGRTTRPLTSAVLQGAEGIAPFRVEGSRFEGRWTPVRSGVYLWGLRGAEGGIQAERPAPVEILLLPDRAPTAAITFPGPDTIAPEDLRQTVRAEVRDDHGLASAALVSWRVGGNGVRDADVELPIALDGSERALLNAQLDLSARNLLPGDTLKYYVRVRDRSPGAQTGVSATHVLRLPTAAELRQRAREQARAALASAESAARAAAQVTAAARNAERRASATQGRGSQSQGGGTPGGDDRARMTYGDTEAARATLRDQEQLLEQVEQLRESMAALERSATEAGLRNAELDAKLAEMRELMEGLVTPELRRQMGELAQSLQQLDPAQMQQALERLATQQEQLQQQLEKQLEMLRRAAAEQELGALAQQARELATQQAALAEAHREAADGAKGAEARAEAQQALAEAGEQLAEELDELRSEQAERNDTTAAGETDTAAQRTRAAQAGMKQAAASAEQQRSDDAARQGRQAAAQLEQAAESLEQASGTMADAGRDEARAAMEQATRDALALAQRQLELQQQMENGGEASEAGQRPALPEPALSASGEQQGEEGSAGAQPPGAQSEGKSAQKSGRSGKPDQSGGAGGSGQQGRAAGAAGSRRSGAPGQPAQTPGERPGGERGAGALPSAAELARMRTEQGALQDGLEQLGDNVQESSARAGGASREVDAALGRAALSMDQTQQGLARAEQRGSLPTEEAAQSVESLNRLALALMNNARQLEQAQGQGGSGGQSRQQLADLAQAQASLNGQAASLLPLGLSASASADQARRLGSEQQQLAQKLDGMSSLAGGREDVLGELDALAREADALARELQGGRIPPEVIARQERLFHRLLDAGRSLEREETGDEREAERPGRVPTIQVAPLDPELLQDGSRFRVPTPAELRSLPPGYRRLILDYFERLNRPLPPTDETEPE